MDLATLALFLPACFALNMAPGPNNLLSLSHAASYGLRRACLAGAGRLLAFAGMIALAACGLAAALHASELLFQCVKLAGALYLFWLAWQLWRSGGPAAAQAPAGLGLLAMARREFLVAAGNPKAVLIFTAFLPQFVDPARGVGPQFLLLGLLFLLLEIAAIAIYAAMGLHLRRWLGNTRALRRFNRGCALLLAGAGAGLLAARRG